jgi:hypothetical protein
MALIASRVERCGVAVRENGIVKTRLDLRIPGDESNAVASVEVDYGRDARLDMWVPIKMVETYTEMRASSVSGEHRRRGHLLQFPSIRNLGTSCDAVGGSERSWRPTMRITRSNLSAQITEQLK